MTTNPGDEDVRRLFVVGTAERAMRRLALVLDELETVASDSNRRVSPRSTPVLAEYNQELIRELVRAGVDWTRAAPAELLRLLNARRREAQQLFGTSDGGRLDLGWGVWADPAFCALGPFWVEVLGLSPTVILVYGEPSGGTSWVRPEIPLPDPWRVGAWERLNRAALSFCDQWSGLVVSAEAMVARPAISFERIVKFLHSRGVVPTDVTVPDVVDFVLDEAKPTDPREAPQELGAVDSVTLNALRYFGRLPGGITKEESRWLADRIGGVRGDGTGPRGYLTVGANEADRPARQASLAEWIVTHIAPRSALHVGCGQGWLVEALRGRDVDAHGIDTCQAVISSLPGSLRPYCGVAPVYELVGSFDLVVCADVLEHLPPSMAVDAVEAICQHTDAVLFSGRAEGSEDPTLLNVQPPGYWAQLFANQGFFRDFSEDTSQPLGIEGVLYRRQVLQSPVLVKHYEDATWEVRKRQADGDALRRDVQTALEDERQALETLRENYRTIERAREETRRLLDQEQLRRRAEGVAHLDRMNAQERSQRALVARAEAAEQQAELLLLEVAAFRRTKTFRYIDPLRRAYGRLVNHRSAEPAAPPTRTEPGVGDSYQKWIEMYDTLDESARRRLHKALDGLVTPPLISVIMPVYETPERHLRQAVASVQRQLYSHWELCIADDGSSSPWIAPMLDSWAAEDDRIKVVHRDTNGHISVATNTAFGLARGSWIALVDHDDVLPEQALAIAALTIARQPQAGMLYTDEDTIDESGNRQAGYFKPEYDPLLLLGENYLAHLCLIRRDLVERVGGWRVGFEGSQDWDLVLRVSELLRQDQVVHVPHVLYHWRVHPGSTAGRPDAKPYAAAAGQRAVAEHLRRGDRSGDVLPVPMTGWNRVRWTLPKQPPTVSIIVPTRDSPLLRRCIDSVRRLTSYPTFEIVVIDNGSRGVESLEYLRILQGDVTVIRDEREFNFSALNNEAVRQCDGEVICLLNDDTEVISRDWLEEMVGQLVQPGVGAVGAKLYYEDGRVQHAGVLLGVDGLAAHSHRLYDRLSPGYFGRLVLPQRYSAVTAACMVVRRTAWQQVGGLDEVNLGVAFNDVDFCLRLREAGWSVVWTPAAELIHHESVTRGDDADDDRHLSEVRYMKWRWSEALFADPAYNPNLTIAGEPFTLAWPPRTPDPA